MDPNNPKDEVERVYRKVTWRLIPFMCLLYLVAYLDRVNVGYAALTMNQDIGLSALAYGTGAGIFFIGYFLFEIPSNLILHRVGARLWIARIMVSWGVLSTGMAAINSPWAFYLLRFLLGVAEAGFFPGMILYLTYWYPGSRRARILAAFLTAVPLSSVIGAPISTALLQSSVFGLAGWRTMFILEGVPAIVLGLLVAIVLTDRPAVAKWLTEREKTVISDALSADAPPAGQKHSEEFSQALRNGRVWVLAIIYFAVVIGLYGLGFWAPQIVKDFGGLSLKQVGLLTALPYVAAVVGMWFWGRRSDRKLERVGHLTAAAALACGGFLVGGLSAEPAIRLIALTAAVVGVHAALPVFWTLPTQMLKGRAAAGGIALINSIGNLSGYVGPFLMGLATQATGSFSLGLLMLGAWLALAAVITYAMGRGMRSPAA